MAQEAIRLYGLPLFGNNIVWVNGRYGIDRTTDYFYVDCSYINIAMIYGIIVLILVVFGYSVPGYKASKEYKYILCISIIMLAIHSFSDPQLLDLEYNPFPLLLMGSLIRNRFPIPLPEQNENERVFSNGRNLICGSKEGRKNNV